MKSKLELTLNWIVFFIQIVTSCLFLYIVYTIQLVPMNYIYILGAILLLLVIGAYFLIFYKKPKSKRSLITQILSIILSGVMVVGAFYVYKVGTVVDLLTAETFQKRAISVIVLKDSDIRNENMLPDHQVGYISSIDAETMDYAAKEIKKDVGEISLTNYNDFAELVSALYDKKVDAIILDEAFRTLVDEHKETFDDDTRVIYQVLKDEGTINAK